MFNKRLYIVSLIIILALNALSFLAIRSSLINWLAFNFILIATALLAWKNLYYGLIVLLTELMISSHGHLFDVYFNSFRFSMRMGIFAILLIVSAARIITPQFILPTTIKFTIRTTKNLILAYKWYLLFGFFILIGVANGLLQKNRLSYLYQDVNGYLFFLLLPVFLIALKPKKSTNAKLPTTQLLSVWAAAITWQFLVSTILLFLYGHVDLFWRGLVPVYSWFRDQRIIEVGLYNYNFYRVFMQSALWALTGFFVFLSLWWNRTSDKKNTPYIEMILISLITVLLISLSRSFWLSGLIVALLYFTYQTITTRPRIISLCAKSARFGALCCVSIAIIAGALILPIGKTPGLKSLASISERGIDTEDAAISSRWDLYPALWKGIKSNLIFGNGFGATVIYKTSDPRYIAAHPGNPNYETFAFEWGWLDVWYKIGFLGLLTYAALLGSVLYRGWKNIRPAVLENNTNSIYYSVEVGLFFGLIAIIITHSFTPFLNHPLGVGYILLTDSIFRKQ